MKTTNTIDKLIFTCQLLCVYVQCPHLAWDSQEFQKGGLQSPLGQVLISPNKWMEPSAFSLLSKYSQQDIIKPKYVFVLTSREWIILEAIFLNIAMRKEEYVKPAILQHHIEKLCRREDVAMWFTAEDIYSYMEQEERALTQAEIN